MYTLKQMLLVCVVGILLSAPLMAAPMMGSQMMDEDDYREMMSNRWGSGGPGYGPMMGYGYGGHPMMGYGGMMDNSYGGHPMMGYGGMMGPGFGGYGNMMGYGGMMGPIMHGLGGLNLNDSQRKNIVNTMRDLRKKHWAYMEQMMDGSDQLYDLYSQTPRDANKIAAVYEKIFSIKLSMIKDMIEFQNKLEAGLTEEQRNTLRQFDRGNMGYGMMR